MASGIGLTHPASYVRAITPHNSTNFPDGVCRAIYIGTTGNVVVVDPTDTAVIHYNCQAGSVLPVQAKRVNATDTTATFLIAYY